MISESPPNDSDNPRQTEETKKGMRKSDTPPLVSRYLIIRDFSALDNLKTNTPAMRIPGIGRRVHQVVI